MKQFEQICICRIDRIGDLIITTPILKAIRENWPKSKITLLASKSNSKVLEFSNLIDEIIIIDNNYSLSKKISILLQIRKRKFNHFINLSPTNLSYFLCFFSKALNKSTIIFLSRYKQKFSKWIYRFFSNLFCQYTHIVNRKFLLSKNLEIHQTKMMYLLLEKISKKTFNYSDIEIPVNSEVENKVQKLFSQKIVTIHLSNRWNNNYYNSEDLHELISKIKNNKKYTFFLTTEKTNDRNFYDIINKYMHLYPKDFIYTESTKEKLNGNIFILDNYNYNDWISIIKQSNQVITPESGCTHVAAAFKIPVIIIYNDDNVPEDIYKEYSPWQSPHKKLIFRTKNDINENIIKELN